MSFIEAFILSLALCVDTLVVSTTTAFREMRSAGDTSSVSPTSTSPEGKARGSWRRGLLLAVILGFCQFAFPLVGALIGDVARAFIEAVDHWIAFGLLAIIGGKMILDAIRGGEEEEGKVQNAGKFAGITTVVYRYFLLGVATSIDGLAVGIGLGLAHPMDTVMWVVLLIGVTTLLVALLGYVLGSRRIPIPERTATLVAGVVLVGLGVKILLEHLGLFA